MSGSPVGCRHPWGALLAALMCILATAGCSVVVSQATDGFARTLTSGIVDADDPETVRAGIPAYLLLIDGFVAQSPDDPSLLAASATLRGAFASNFVDDPERRAHMSAAALSLALDAQCAADEAACGLRDWSFERFQAWAREAEDIDLLFVLGSAWAGYVQTHSDDWNAVAELSRVRAVFERVLAIDETYEQGGAHLYLGALDTFLPPAMGGRPEDGRAHFERVIEISGGRHLTAKVLMASDYARLVFDRDLHDRLLAEVLEADPHVPGLTLANVVAQRNARSLLDSGDDYF